MLLCNLGTLVGLPETRGLSQASPNSHKSYRPLVVLSFRLSYWLCGSTDSAAQMVYHAENVGWHALASLLFLHTVRKVAGPAQVRCSNVAPLALGRTRCS